MKAFSFTRRLSGAPFLLLVTLELVLLSVLGLLAWQAIQRYQVVPAVAKLPGRIQSLPGMVLPTGALPSPTPLPGMTSIPPAPAPPPGLAPNAATLNQAEGRWSRAEWGIIGALMGAAQRYIDGVVLPSIDQAAANASR